ncbi:Protein of unknown function [Gryllus bimaculatus]|nr:Protein of unknown function [Gryllus bimaculatus]
MAEENRGMRLSKPAARMKEHGERRTILQFEGKTACCNMLLAKARMREKDINKNCMKELYIRPNLMQSSIINCYNGFYRIAGLSSTKEAEKSSLVSDLVCSARLGLQKSLVLTYTNEPDIDAVVNKLDVPKDVGKEPLEIDESLKGVYDD